MSAPVSGARDVVPFFDLQAQLTSIRPAVRAAIEDVLDDGAFTNGPAVAANWVSKADDLVPGPAIRAVSV